MLLISAVVVFVVFLTGAGLWLVLSLFHRRSDRGPGQAILPSDPRLDFVRFAKLQADEEKAKADAEALFALAKKLSTPIPSTLSPVPVAHPSATIPSAEAPGPK